VGLLLRHAQDLPRRDRRQAAEVAGFELEGLARISGLRSRNRAGDVSDRGERRDEQQRNGETEIHFENTIFPPVTVSVT